ncbi:MULTISPECIES: hypothetical protein [unclassified Hydrogenobaculum]|uniref:hypothetical protein n=1 Tax=Hydrogenobaculum sp. (strain Y04AAS1) TaxID=380749 RepID=UPI0030800EDF
MSYILYMVSSSIPLYHAINTPQNPKLNTYHIVSSLPNKTLNNTSSTNPIQNIVSFYKDSYEQAFINACENARWLSIKNNCSNPNDFNQAWSFLPSLTGNVNNITGSNIAFSCNTKSAFGEYVLYNSISSLQSNTCVSCYYNLNSNNAIPYSGLLPYKSSSYYGTNTTHSLTSMGDPCAVGSFISCTYVCS